ncbi:MAG: hydrogenase expression/formation protein [Pseudomonadota bacterium]
MQGFSQPPFGFGPGSQPEPSDGRTLDYLPLPSGMQTYAMHLPEVEDAGEFGQALAVLKAVADACLRGEGRFDLLPLPAGDRDLLTETFGVGEVSCRHDGHTPLIAQEAVFAGVWRVKARGLDYVEVGPVPSAIAGGAFEAVTPAAGTDAPALQGVVNAPALVVELLEKAAAWTKGTPPHVINLTLLPHTLQDLEHFDTAFGRGAATLLSRGYGNCRIEATAVRNLWRVKFFNSMDALILDSFEVTDMPEVARAAPEDLEDSAGRIEKVLEALS